MNIVQMATKRQCLRRISYERMGEIYRAMHGRPLYFDHIVTDEDIQGLLPADRFSDFIDYNAHVFQIFEQEYDQLTKDDFEREAEYWRTRGIRPEAADEMAALVILNRGSLWNSK